MTDLLLFDDFGHVGLFRAIELREVHLVQRSVWDSDRFWRYCSDR